MGLDIGHETNRLRAAERCRDTARAQITGPIVLVQDEEQTPGFLFYVPIYEGGFHAAPEARQERFAGMVYAPFVMKRLMRGVLDKENRHVGVRISDGGAPLYDELTAGEPDYDPEPLKRVTLPLLMYGRNWVFDVWSSKSFRSAAKSSQPMTILLSGLTIDAFLIVLFGLISRANRRALAYADALTHELQGKAQALEQSNQELERFAYVASHDLQEPLRMVRSFSQLVDEEYRCVLDKQGREWLGFLVDGATRMQALVRDLLAYSKVGRVEAEPRLVDTDAILDEVLRDLTALIQEADARVVRDSSLPELVAVEGELRLVLQNLICNAIKFRRPETSPVVEIGAEFESHDCRLFVRDNGIGIEPEYQERIFVIFQRLHAKTDYPGTGIGLAICKKIVERLGGRIWFESTPGRGSTFYVSLPMACALDSVAPALGTGSRTPTGTEALR